MNYYNYSENSLEDQNNNTSILKNNTTLSLSEYEKIKLQDEYNKLYTNSAIENNKNIDKKIQQRVYNLSLKNITDNTAKTLINILNDLVMFREKQNKTFNDFMYIFVKDDRLIYICVILMIIAILLFFITVSN